MESPKSRGRRRRRSVRKNNKQTSGYTRSGRQNKGIRSSSPHHRRKLGNRRPDCSYCSPSLDIRMLTKKDIKLTIKEEQDAYEYLKSLEV